MGQSTRLSVSVRQSEIGSGLRNCIMLECNNAIAQIPFFSYRAATIPPAAFLIHSYRLSVLTRWIGSRFLCLDHFKIIAQTTLVVLAPISWIANVGISEKSIDFDPVEQSLPLFYFFIFPYVYYFPLYL